MEDFLFVQEGKNVFVVHMEDFLFVQVDNVVHMEDFLFVQVEYFVLCSQETFALHAN